MESQISENGATWSDKEYNEKEMLKKRLLKSLRWPPFRDFYPGLANTHQVDEAVAKLSGSSNKFHRHCRLTNISSYLWDLKKLESLWQSTWVCQPWEHNLWVLQLTATTASTHSGYEARLVKKRASQAKSPQLVKGTQRVQIETKVLWSWDHPV